MRNKIIQILAFLCITSALSAQSSTELLLGKVTFATANSIYVKFDNTEYIAIGDTLLFSSGAAIAPCLVVKQKSTSSCVCAKINDCEIKKDDQVFFKHIKKDSKEESNTEESIIEIESPSTQKKVVAIKPRYKERIRGRLSAAGYSSLSPSRGDRYRTMYRFSLNAGHIKNSKFSFETYLNYRQNFIPKDKVGDRKTKFFRVYSLAVKYDVDSTLSLLLGRKINNKTASLGAIDGVQAEKFFGKNFVGLVAGFRPDIREYGFNPNLFQYGLYLGRKTNTKKTYSQSTLGLLEQRNKGAIDRRYVYFQHSSTFFRKLSLFGSVEMDIYNKVNDVSSTAARLTNLYLSARYRFHRRLNFSVAYDARKRVLYYETLKTEIERLLDDDETRQGIRFRVNGKPFKYINVGVSYSKRFQSDRQNKSDNINAYVSLSKVPTIGGRLSVNFNMNTSSYLESKIISLRHSRTLIKKKLNAGFYFRMVNYQYLKSELAVDIQYYGLNLSYKINRKLTFSILGELAAKKAENSYRVNAKIIKRFRQKK